MNLETSFGEIETSMPVTIQGRISKDHIKGTIGQPALPVPSTAEGSEARGERSRTVEGGTGKLTLKTSFGDIKLK